MFDGIVNEVRTTKCMQETQSDHDENEEQHSDDGRVRHAVSLCKWP